MHACSIPFNLGAEAREQERLGLRTEPRGEQGRCHGLGAWVGWVGVSKGPGSKFWASSESGKESICKAQLKAFTAFPHIDCSCFVSKTFGFCVFYFNLTVILDYCLFYRVLEKQEIVVPHLLLQKCNNKLPQNKIFLRSYTVYVEGCVSAFPRDASVFVEKRPPSLCVQPCDVQGSPVSVL